jgi:hypothetical protein
VDDSDYDESMRYLARRARGALMHWLLQLDQNHVRFDTWEDPVLVWPGMKERVCDLIARLANLDKGGIPTAGIVEFQTQPDPRMFGRLMVAGGMCWLDVKPANLPGDRFELCAVVVNLTGQGNCARHMSIGTTEWKMTPRELNLETLDAAVVLEDVAAGQAPRELLAVIPVMKNGDGPVIIDRWQEIAGPEKGPELRGCYALAAVFAGAVGRRELWKKALEGFTMNESPVAREWRAEARREGEIKAKADMVVRVLKRRLGEGAVPEDVVTRIKACTDSDQLDRWMDMAALATTLQQFLDDAGL